MKTVQILLEDLMWDKRIKSINELSEKSGISRPTLSRLAKGQAKGISLETIQAICTTLDCNVQDLIQVKQGD